MAKENDKWRFLRDQLNKIKAILSEWVTLLTLISRPAIILPLGIAVLALYVASISDISKEVKLILNIVAALASGIAGGATIEWWKNISGNTIVVKKGQSAVRNLTLIREKAKNIAERTRSKSNLEEIENLLGLLEKDLGNSIKDWNDILPAVVATEDLYAKLDEKEKENHDIRSQIEKLKEDLEKEKTWTTGEKEELKKLIAAKEEEAAKLRVEIKNLKSMTLAATYALTATPLPASALYYTVPAGDISYESLVLTGGQEGTCKNCGKKYKMRAIGENGLCNECNK